MAYSEHTEAAIRRSEVSKYAVEVLIGEDWGRLRHVFDKRTDAVEIARSSRGATIVKDVRIVELDKATDQHLAKHDE
jgi:hypothetical protein